MSDGLVGTSRGSVTRWTLRVGVVLIAVQFVTRGITALRGFFYLDDFGFMGRAMEHGLLDPEYVGAVYNNHVMPGAWIWVWLTTRAFPLSFSVVALTALILQLVLSVLVFRFLLDLFGPSPLILPPLAIAVLSPISLPAHLWWAAALNQLPLQIAVVLLLHLQLRNRVANRWSTAIGSAGALAGGLFFSEKTLIGLVLAWGITVCWFTGGRWWSRPWAAVRRQPKAALAQALIAVPYTAGYLLWVPSPVREVAAPGHDVVDMVLTSVFEATVPGLLGGPLHWSPIGYAGALADPDALAVVLYAALGAGIVIATTLVNRRAGRAWSLLAVLMGLNLLLLAVSRAAVVGPVVALEYRYQTEIAVFAAVLFAFALMPPRGFFSRHAPDAVGASEARRAVIREKALGPLRAAGALPSSTEGAVAGLLTVVVVAGSLWSALAYDPWWTNNPAKPWVSTVRAGIAGLPPGTRLADGAVPQEVAWGLLYPYNETYRVLSPVLRDDQRLGAAATASTIVAPANDGTLFRALISGSLAPPGPKAGCGWQLGLREVSIPVSGGVQPQRPTVRLGFVAQEATTLSVRSPDRVIDLPLTAGLGVIHFQLDRPTTELTFLPTADAVAICTDDLAVGTAVPIEGQLP